MAKNFKISPLDKLSKPATNPDPDIQTAAGEQNAAPIMAAGEPEQPKRRPGRPKVKPEQTKTINIAVPVSVLAKTEIAKKCYNNNLTEYVNKLIERDLSENFDKYETIYNSLNNL